MIEYGCKEQTVLRKTFDDNDMKIAIVEDEAEPRALLLEYLERFQKERPHFSYESELFSSAEDFLAKIQEGQEFDLLFLDIELTGINGFEMAKKLRETNQSTDIIFVTNLNQYAVKGYEVDAMDYCLKPLTYPDFLLKITKAIRRYLRDARQKLVKTDVNGATVIMLAKDILYVEITKHYLTYHLIDGRDVMVRGSMKEAAEELSVPGFFRTNSCYIVNMKNIESIAKDEIIIRGRKNLLPISRARKSAFLEAFASYIGALK